MRTASTSGASGIDHRVEPPRPHALELVLPAVLELDAGACHEVTNGVGETSTSPGPAAPATPATLSPRTSHSPVWRPARTSMPKPRTPLPIARAQRIARAGPSKVARKPSPAVSI